jgi:hypothetical protein
MSAVEQMEKNLADLRRRAEELRASVPNMPGVFEDREGSYE